MLLPWELRAEKSSPGREEVSVLYVSCLLSRSYMTHIILPS